MSQDIYHIPALLDETIRGLDIKPDGTYVDATFGGGGHSYAITELLSPKGHLYSFDQDEQAIERAFSDPKFTIIYSNFRFIKNFMRYYDVEGADGILADLGVSFHHFDDSERGFSFRWDSRLDMRMNQRAPYTAAWIIANYTEEQLARLFELYGELKNGRRIAAAIIRQRQSGVTIDTVTQLLETIRPYINPRQEKKELAMVFQALRIEVNEELKALEEFLIATLSVLKPGGRLAIITYHSLEDRMVKNFMRSGNIENRQNKDFFGHLQTPFKILTTKPIIPSEEEIARNPRSRSAKLRIAQKL